MKTKHNWILDNLNPLPGLKTDKVHVLKLPIEIGRVPESREIS
jgi:hypothetical protein